MCIRVICPYKEVRPKDAEEKEPAAGPCAGTVGSGQELPAQIDRGGTGRSGGSCAQMEMQENKRPSCTQALLSMAPENDLRQFVDRDREIRYFIECLYKIATGELNNSVIVLHGMPCVGKRSLLTLLRKITDTYGRERRRIYEQLEMSITSSELFEPRCKTIHLLLRDSDTLLRLAIN